MHYKSSHAILFQYYEVNNKKSIGRPFIKDVMNQRGSVILPILLIMFIFQKG